MFKEDPNSQVRETGSFVFDRMFGAVEKVRERLDRACKALEEGQVPYAIIGGNAVAAWVATVDDGAVRNTRLERCHACCSLMKWLADSVAGRVRNAGGVVSNSLGCQPQVMGPT